MTELAHDGSIKSATESKQRNGPLLRRVRSKPGGMPWVSWDANDHLGDAALWIYPLFISYWSSWEIP